MGGEVMLVIWASASNPPTAYLNDNNIKHANACQLSSFTTLRALLVLHDRGSAVDWTRQLAESLGRRGGLPRSIG
jgi:hypothetical protein